MLAKHNDVIHSELASVCAADCDEDASVARVEIHARNHEVVACITIHRVHGIAGIVEASPELTLKARLVPKRRVSRIVEVYDLVTDKNSRRTGYGMLQDAFFAPYTVNLLASVYTVVGFNCYKASVTSRFVGYLDAELVVGRTNELHLTRPQVFQLGYGMLSPDESHDAVDVAIRRCRLNARVRGIQRRLDYAVVGKSPVVDISQRHTDVSYVRA